MQHIFKITGIDCPNCALKLEKQISNIKGVEEASINFFGEKLLVKYDEDVEDEITKICKNFEDGITLKRLK